MGAVFVAEQPSLQRQVAVKVMARSDSKARARFQREGRIAAGLAHANILPVYACGEQDGTAWIAMQLVTGAGLDRVIETLADGHRPPAGGGLVAVVQALHTGARLERGEPGADHYRDIARLGAQAAEALAHAHRAGVLHRDVKPANLLLGTDGRLWVADFGLAKADGDENVTGTRLVAGTLRYTAPERFSGRCDARSDVYALGVTLFELTTLRPAFAARGPGPVMSEILSGGVPDPAPFAPLAPPALVRAIRRACAVKPEDRQADAATFAAELRAAADGSVVTETADVPVVGSAVAAPVASTPSLSTAPSRSSPPVLAGETSERLWLPWLVAATGVALVLLAWWMLLPPLERRPPPDRDGPRPEGRPPGDRPPPPGAWNRRPPPPGDRPSGDRPPPFPDDRPPPPEGEGRP